MGKAHEQEAYQDFWSLVKSLVYQGRSLPKLGTGIWGCEGTQGLAIESGGCQWRVEEAHWQAVDLIFWKEWPMVEQGMFS